MIKEDKFNGLSLLRIILYVLTIIGIWFIYKEWVRRKEVKKKLIGLIPSIQQALSDYKQLFNYEVYFAFIDEQKYIELYLPLRQNIAHNFDSVGLSTDHVNLIKQFVNALMTLSAERKTYNDLFVVKEAEKFADLFANLAEYPLSQNQIEAVLHDEDNNLVVAGAGTGKTTTISAKVAYILNKGLAKPEELLIISFTNNAVNEMFARTTAFCQNVLGDKILDVRTFNSFGYMVKRQSTQSHFNLAFDGSDEETKAFLQSTFDQLFVDDANFQNKAVNFIAFFSRPERDEFAFDTGNDFIKHEKNFKNITLNGITVKSKEEMEIGNFFYLFSVNFEYEHPFPLRPEDTNFDRGQYLPDFYLPDYEIWHEHYGIDENGNVPEWFSYSPPFKNAKEYYHSLMKWKDGIHSKYGTKLIKTYSYDSKRNRLVSSLKKQLEDLGVEFKKRDPSEILEVIHQSAHYEDFMNLVYTFLNLMKSNNKMPVDFKEIKDDKRLTVFLDVFKPLYQKYQARIAADGAIDYNDMINEATKHINQGDFRRPYKYILVDEFQDMSLGRYELVKSLKRANPGVKLYGVGDDWQSIFRFTGSDISIITKFEENFGFTHQSHILQTYRFNSEILGTTSTFIQKNPSQIQKQLSAGFEATAPSFSFVGLNYQSLNGGERKALKFIRVDELLSEIERLGNGDTVFLIGRYHHNQVAQFNQLCAKHSCLSIKYFTAHSVKGLTCDYSILLDVDSGKLGFPSEIADDPILNYLLFEGDSFDNAEERRVFYVAMSRARHRNYIVFDETSPSKFVLEIIADGNVENPFADAINCPKCKGRMAKRNGPRNQFYGCTNYPQCNGILAIISNESV